MDSGKVMKWLVDVELTTAGDAAVENAWSDRMSPVGGYVAAPRTGDPLVNVHGTLAVLWVYSWLPLAARPKTFMLRAPVVEALLEATTKLPDEYELLLLDGWRTKEFQAELRDYYSRDRQDLSGYVANPDGDVPPPHTTGGAVDLTLRWRGAALGLGTDYDDFSEMAAPNHLETVQHGGLARSRRLRDVLSRALSSVGFVPYPTEWWHWSIGDRVWADHYGVATPPYSEVRTPAV